MQPLLTQNSHMNVCCCCLVARSCLTLFDSMDYSPPGSFVHGISQARILEQIAISFSRGFSWPRDRTCVSRFRQVDSLPLSHLGSHMNVYGGFIHSSQKLKTTLMSLTGEWIHQYNGIWFINKKRNGLPILATGWVKFTCPILMKETTSKNICMCSMFPFIWDLEKTD